MKIALLCNERPDRVPPGLPEDAFAEYDTSDTLEAVAAALEITGARVERVTADPRLPWGLAAGGFDFVFNVAEGEGRRCREAVPAAVCELLGIPFTGPDALTLAVTLDKALAKRLVRDHGEGLGECHAARRAGRRRRPGRGRARARLVPEIDRAPGLSGR